MSLRAVEGTNNLWESEEVTMKDMTVNFLLENTIQAAQLGCNAWGTQTNKDVEPWVTKILFWERVI